MRRFLPSKIRSLLAVLLIMTLLVPPLSNFFITDANAGALSPIRLEINNSQSGATNVTYRFFWTTSVTTDIKQIGIKVCTTGGAYTDACTVPAGFSPGSPTLSSDNIAGSGRTTTDPNSSGERFRVVVGTPATQNSQQMQLTFTGVTNPSGTNTSFFVRVRTFSDTGSAEIDSGVAAAATLNTTSIGMSATVDANFTFAIAAVNSGGTVNSESTTVTTTATTIPFGTQTPSTPSVGAHDVTITTNAGNGYRVTASHSATAQSGFPPLISGSTNNIDTFTGTNASPAVWSEPGGSTANTNTGFFGYTTEDASLCTGTANRFTDTGNEWAGSTTTGEEVVCSTAGVSSQTTRLGWQLEVNSIQPAGTYTGTVILIATPTY